jgi:hypothetical protein
MPHECFHESGLGKIVWADVLFGMQVGVPRICSTPRLHSTSSPTVSTLCICFFKLSRCCRLRPMHCCEMPVPSVNYKPTLCCDLRSMCNGAQCRSLITGRNGHRAGDHSMACAQQRQPAARHRQPHVHDMPALGARQADRDISSHGCGCGYNKLGPSRPPP